MSECGPPKQKNHLGDFNIDILWSNGIEKIILPCGKTISGGFLPSELGGHKNTPSKSVSPEHKKKQERNGIFYTP